MVNAKAATAPRKLLISSAMVPALADPDPGSPPLPYLHALCMAGYSQQMGSM